MELIIFSSLLVYTIILFLNVNTEVLFLCIMMCLQLFVLSCLGMLVAYGITVHIHFLVFTSLSCLMLVHSICELFVFVGTESLELLN